MMRNVIVMLYLFNYQVIFAQDLCDDPIYVALFPLMCGDHVIPTPPPVTPVPTPQPTPRPLRDYATTIESELKSQVDVSAGLCPTMGSFGNLGSSLNDKLTQIADNLDAINSAFGTANTALSSITTTTNNIQTQINKLPGMKEALDTITTVSNTAKTNIATVQSLADHVVTRVNVLPGIVTVVNQIKGLVDDIPIISDTVDDIKTLADDIPKILETLSKNPFGIMKNLDDEIAPFATAIATCVQEIVSVFDPIKALFDVIHMIDLSVGDFPNPTELIYKVMAIALYDKKPLIQSVCNNVVPRLVDIVNDIIEGSIFNRRRMQNEASTGAQTTSPTPPPTNRVMKDHTNPSFTYENPDNTKYISMVHSSKPTLIPFYNDYSDTNEYQVFRIVNLVLGMFGGIGARVVEIVDDIASVKEGNCVPVAVAHGFLEANKFTMEMLDFFMGFADVHDGEINNVKLKAVFEDRLTIINNQFAMDEIMKGEFDDLRKYLDERFAEELSTLHKGFLGISATTGAVVDRDTYNLKTIKNVVGSISTKLKLVDCGGRRRRIMVESQEIDDELVTIALKQDDLYLYGLVFLGMNVLLVMVVMIIACKYDSKNQVYKEKS